MIAILVFCAVIGLFVYWGSRSAKKRSAGLQTAHAQLGLARLEDTAPAGGQTGLNLFSLGRTHTTTELFGGTVDSLETQVFDYAYTERESNGDYSTTQQTAGAFRRPGASMPAFHMLPSNLMQRAVAGMNRDVRIDDEAFRMMYLVRGAETSRIQEIFTPALVEAFKLHDQKRRWHVEGAGEWLLVFRAGKRVAATDLPQFLKEGAAVAHLVFQQQSGAALSSATMLSAGGQPYAPPASSSDTLAPPPPLVQPASAGPASA